MKTSKFVFYIASVIAVLGINIFFSNQIAQIGYNVEQLKKELANIKNENRELECIISQKENLEAIDKIALTKLKMQYPKSIEYILTTPEHK